VIAASAGAGGAQSGRTEDMSNRFVAPGGASCRWFARAAIAAGIAAFAAPACADDLPAFRKGLWEFSRTIDAGGGKTQTIKSSKCTSPGEDMKAQNERLAKSGCKFSPTVRSGSTYTFSSQCSIQGISAQSTSVITVDSDSAYRLNVDGTAAGEKTHEVLLARRIGDCK
jgi:hypothetical protein